MKIEIIRIERLNGDVFYHLEKNGKQVGSCSMDLDVIEKMFDMALRSGSTEDTKTVLKSIEIWPTKKSI